MASVSNKTLLRTALASVVFAMTIPLSAGDAAAQSKTVGPNACAECHTEETKIWKNTHHHKTFRVMPRSKEARAIAKKLKIRRIKSSKLCKGCHFTEEIVRNKPRITAGIACESCHGEGKEWIKVHSEFSGKGSKEAEGKALATKRWETAAKKGMIRPGALYDLAKNCYSCHVVPREDLVNIGGHPAGSTFNLVSWSQGEIRHNTWYTKGKNNQPASADRKRILYIMGLIVELETALRSVAVSTKPKTYAVRMAHRANEARIKMAAVVKATGNVPELRAILSYGHEAGLKLNNNKALTAAADKISKEARKFLANHDGKSFTSVDGLLPKPDKYRGEPKS